MQTTILFAAIFAVANALPSVAPLPEQDSYLSLISESFAKREDLPEGYKGEPCSKFEGSSIKNTPAVCLKSLFCEKKQPDYSEDCHFDGQLKFTEEQLKHMSENCKQQAVCNIIRESEGPRKKDTQVPALFLQHRDTNFYGESCKDLNEEDWTKIPKECINDILCVQPVLDREPKCAYINDRKKSYTGDELFKLRRECAREIVCNRGISSESQREQK